MNKANELHEQCLINSQECWLRLRLISTKVFLQTQWPTNFWSHTDVDSSQISRPLPQMHSACRRFFFLFVCLFVLFVCLFFVCFFDNGAHIRDIKHSYLKLNVQLIFLFVYTTAYQCIYIGGITATIRHHGCTRDPSQGPGKMRRRNVSQKRHRQIRVTSSVLFRDDRSCHIHWGTPVINLQTEYARKILVSIFYRFYVWLISWKLIPPPTPHPVNTTVPVK